MMLLYNLEPDAFEKFKYVKYISLQSLIVYTMQFSLTAQGTPILLKQIGAETWHLIPYEYIPFNKIAISICTIIMPAITTGMLFLNIHLFKNKNLNI